MITIIIPVKPPEPYLDRLEDEIHSELKDVPHEILVQTEKGLSYAVRKGVEKASGEVIVVIDADGSHNAKYIKPMIDLISQGYDLVLGSRYVKGGKANLGSYRGLISRVYCKLACWMLHLNVEDPMTGFVVGRKELFRRLEKADTSYKFGLEMICEADRACEYPIVFEKRKKGRSKANWRQGIETLRLMWNLRKHS